MSPLIFKNLSELTGEAVAYFGVDLEPWQVDRFMELSRRWGWAGFNVTHPLKELVMRRLGVLSDEARAVGAVNTVKLERGRWAGYNTDGEGLIAALVEHGVKLKSEAVCVWGAGGAAGAACLAAARLGASRVFIRNRSARRARSLAKRMEAAFPGTSFEPAAAGQRAVRKSVLWINATPVGMPGLEGSGRTWSIPADARGTACDFVYSSAPTPFLEAARKSGLGLIGGREILIYQALAAWEIWVGSLGRKRKIKRLLEKRLPSPVRSN